ncbi:esterase/lipase family protein [Paenibacillus apiarius]|uniref:triacylglycerol lipase n=1 Tax=Paenibacillus apiarius TaxID=46240 RepID=A0ABT4DYH2_9BACL|nr:lipase [Paenibacillus apiarius]MCY9514451.1 lipase [Paenibacillus apiarius]MCY9521011.1 lipase [Paenibacillus apiarius]MCY9551857.1 lipase [Paenibacillus apiarius]MCY9557745.1 lipase [Paenibacillus apiarius]MCY9684432.1 lipase [Paenibacillus apiarius]
MQRRLSLCMIFLILFYSIFNARLPDAHAQTNDYNNELSFMSPLQNTIHKSRQNDYPIVLVHGFGGWGREEMLGFKYWGGFSDIQDDLRHYGYSVFTAAVGPVSSSWDRACELYAQIKGGTVDYGEAHSSLHNHARYGRTYEGLYPEWGEINPKTGKPRRIHLLAHSQGGQTARLFIQLLENGSASERDVTPGSDLSPLFSDKQAPHVSSLVAIASPHDGTSLTHFIEGIAPFAQQIIGLAAAVAGNSENPVYDFKLDQWGLKRMPEESFLSYSTRIYKSAIWRDTKDVSQWDLSPDGAKELNEWVKAQPRVYYFSVSAEKTFRVPLFGWHVPKLHMNPFLVVSGLFIGSYAANVPERVAIDSDWWQNDGLVNTISMSGPRNGSNDQIIAYNGRPQMGKWNYLGLMASWDHADTVGLSLTNPHEWYRDIADLLGSLPID